MNKFITKLAKLFLGISMAAGGAIAISAGRKDASPVRADVTPTVSGNVTTWTFTQKADIGTSTTWHYASSSDEPTGYEANRGVAWNKKGTTIQYTTTFAVSNVTIDVSANATGGTIKVNSSSAQSIESSAHQNKSFDVDVASGSTISIVTTAAGSKTVWIKAISITKKSSDEATSVTLSLGKNTLTSVGDTTTVTAVVKDSSSATISGASVSFDAPSPAGVVSLSGDASLSRTVTAITDGTATITVNYAGVSGKYQPSSKSIQIIVETPEILPEGTSGDATFTSNAKVVVNSVENDAIKIGTGSSGGSAAVTVPANAVAMTFRAASWKGESETLTITGVSNVTPSGADSYIAPSDDGMTGNSPFTVVGAKKTYLHTINFTKTTADTEVTFASSSDRVVIWEIKYYLDNTKYTVSFNANNDGYSGEVPGDITQSSGGASITLPAALSLTGYTFLGWNTSSSGGQSTRKAAGSSYTPTSNHTLYGEWQLNSYTVNGGSTTANITNGHLSSAANVNHGSQLSVSIVGNTYYTYPDSLTSVYMGNVQLVLDSGYTYSGGVVTIASVTGNVVITASCKATVTMYSVTFYANGHGTAPAVQNVASGQKATEPAAPSEVGYSFGGWFTETACTNQWNFNTTVTGNVELYAKWTALASITVSFNANGHGTAPESQTKYEGSLLDEPTAPTASGWVFGGWFKEQACTNQWNFSSDTVSSSLTTLYAKWSESQERNVTFDFSKIDFSTDWSGTYAGQDHTIEYDQGDVSFTDTAHASTTITDIPVTKAGTASFVAGEGIEITGVTFVLRQWGTKTKTATLYYSTDGGENYLTTGVTSETFRISKNDLASGTNAIKIDFTETTNQVGFESLTIVYTGGSAPVATTYSVTYASGGADSGSVPTDPHGPYNSGDTVTVLGNTGNLVKSGYSFAGWSNGTNTYVAEDTFTISSDTTLTAQWTSDTPSSGSSYFYKLSSLSDITDGYYIIAAQVGDNYYAMSNTFAKKVSGSSVEVSNDKITSDLSGSNVVHIVALGSNQIAISNGANYLGYSSSTDLRGSATDYSDNKEKWTIGTGSNSGTFHVLNVDTSTRGLIYRSDSAVYGPYSQGNVDDSTYYDIEFFRAYTAADFADHLINKVSCDVSGVNAPTFATGYSWSELGSKYSNQLTTDQQNILKNAQYSVSGSGSSTIITPESGTSQTIANAISKYDKIVTRYSYTNFMSRTSPNHSNIGLLPILGDNTNTVAIIVVISMVSVTAIGGYFFLRKRKEQ